MCGVGVCCSCGGSSRVTPHGQLETRPSIPSLQCLRRRNLPIFGQSRRPGLKCRQALAASSKQRCGQQPAEPTGDPGNGREWMSRCSSASKQQQAKGNTTSLLHRWQGFGSSVDLDLDSCLRSSIVLGYVVWDVFSSRIFWNTYLLRHLHHLPVCYYISRPFLTSPPRLRPASTSPPARIHPRPPLLFGPLSWSLSARILPDWTRLPLSLGLPADNLEL